MKADGISAISSDKRQVSKLTVNPNERLSMANNFIPNLEVYGSSAINFEDRAGP
jgi:hypothetical protein